jgi:hypothetical protein
MAASSTGRCNTIQYVDSTILPREKWSVWLSASMWVISECDAIQTELAEIRMPAKVESISDAERIALMGRITDRGTYEVGTENSCRLGT